jgi:hypothetical protein
MRRLLSGTVFGLVLFVLVVPGRASGWSWPVDGPVLQPFAFDPAHPYAGGQHRGIDIGAAAGDPVRAPAGGVVSFAGTTPGNGFTLSLRTADGYTVSLTHLGSLATADPERAVAVCRELTKKFEEVVRGTAVEVAERFAEAPKGEIVLVLGAGAAAAPDEAAGAGAVSELVAAGVPRRQAAELVARLTGASKNALYKASL